MSLETIKKLVWASNVYFFGSKKISKESFLWFYGFVSAMSVVLVMLAIVWIF